jgi:hypothetical protein
MEVRRRDFAFNFGKQHKKQQQQEQLNPEDLLAARKYISDRTVDPKDRAGHRGGHKKQQARGKR